MSLKVNQLVGFGAAKTNSPLGGFWSYGSVPTVPINIDGGAPPGLSDVDVYVEAGSPGGTAHYVITIAGFITHLSMGGPWPFGSSFELINEGAIFGASGDGGNAASYSGSGGDGVNGGVALELNGLTVDIDTSAGVIYGGGGGGGGGGSVRATFQDSEIAYSGGGGGYGVGGPGLPSTGGALYSGLGPGGTHFAVAVAGASSVLDMTGTTLVSAMDNFSGTGAISFAGTSQFGEATVGNGSITNQTGAPTVEATAIAGKGGDGGDFGQDGTAGDNATGSGSVTLGTGGSGGTTGNSVLLSGGAVNWVAGYPGNVLGPVS